jgi:hypothetical protein
LTMPTTLFVVSSLLTPVTIFLVASDSHTRCASSCRQKKLTYCFVQVVLKKKMHSVQVSQHIDVKVTGRSQLTFIAKCEPQGIHRRKEHPVSHKSILRSVDAFDMI